MNGKFDEHGQPIFTSRYNTSRVADRNIDELIGICRGVVFDGVVSQSEAENLLKWLKTLGHGACEFPSAVLLARLESCLCDGDLSTEESADLFDLITKIVGDSGDFHGPSTTSLPLDDPTPPIIFKRNTFVVTGRCALGPRKIVEDQICGAGGFVAANISRNVSYLVCGHFGSKDWIHTNHGRKIQAAMDLRDGYTTCHYCNHTIGSADATCSSCGEKTFFKKIAIISEVHLAEALQILRP
jgi:hypothetical protein